MEVDVEPSENLTPIQTGIQTLPHELLWSIFNINANMFSNNRALKDTRHFSQVCQMWREMIVERPSVWGQLIDINALCRKPVKDDWRNVVLRRSQGSLLWISGTVSADMEERYIDESLSWTFFASLISEHWSRIQRLVVDVQPANEHDQLWKAMLQPAPHLEVFQVHHGQLQSDEQLFSSSSHDLPLYLFSNDAPSLREFGAERIPISIRAPWLANLRSISFQYPFTLRDALQLLQNTPLLECLNLKDLASEKPLMLPQVTLSHLSELTISDLLEDCNNILAHITPGPGCSLSLKAGDMYHAPFIVQMFSEVAQSISKYLKNFFQTHMSTFVTLNCFSKWLNFFYRDPLTGAFCEINLQFSPESLPPEISTLTVFPIVLSAFTVNPTVFPSVTTLRLCLGVSPAFYTILFDTLLSASTFPCVETLDVPEDTLLHLLRHCRYGSLASHSQSFPFPNLKNLKLWEITGPKSKELARASPLIFFLDSRQQDGCPIKVLDIDISRSIATLTDLRHFGPILDQEAVGMIVKVLCKVGGQVREAVCGGDNVTRLIL